MSLFGPPNVGKLKEEGNVSSLLRIARRYLQAQEHLAIVVQAARALAELNGPTTEVADLFRHELCSEAQVHYWGKLEYGGPDKDQTARIVDRITLIIDALVALGDWQCAPVLVVLSTRQKTRAVALAARAGTSPGPKPACSE